MARVQYLIISSIHDLGFITFISKEINVDFQTFKDPILFFLAAIWGVLKIYNEFKKAKKND